MLKSDPMFFTPTANAKTKKKNKFSLRFCLVGRLVS